MSTADDDAIDTVAAALVDGGLGDRDAFRLAPGVVAALRDAPPSALAPPGEPGGGLPPTMTAPVEFSTESDDLSELTSITPPVPLDREALVGRIADAIHRSTCPSNGPCDCGGVDESERATAHVIIAALAPLLGTETTGGGS